MPMMCGRGRYWAVVLTLISLGTFGVAGCAGSDREATGHAAISRAKTFSSVAELVKGSSDVVEAEVVSEEQRYPLPFDLPEAKNIPYLAGYEVRVKEVGYGQRSAGDLMKVLYTVNPSDEKSPHLQRNRTYLLFVTPSEIPGIKRTDMIVVGMWAGMYVEDGDSVSFEGLDPELQAPMPKTITMAEVRESTVHR
jgi:hypothetical protein